MEFHNSTSSMNHEHTIPIMTVVGNSIFLFQTEKGENICNTIFVDIKGPLTSLDRETKNRVGAKGSFPA